MSPVAHNTLMIVDDEELVLNLLRRCFESKTKYEVFCAKNGEQALELLKEHEVNVILSDVKMPGMSGIDLMREVKQVSPSTAVIIMSGYTDVDHVVAALRQGAQDFVRKPFEVKAIIDCVNRVFERLNMEYSCREASLYLTAEFKHFEVPNDFRAVSQVSLDVARSIVEKGFADESIAESIRVALNEIMINGIEHGNLDISYQQKNTLIEDFDAYYRFLEERARQEEYCHRKIAIECHLTPEVLKLVVRDEGNGFDHSDLPDPTDPSNLLTCHGRGILMARIYMDELTFNAKGNEVTMLKYKVPPSSTPTPA